MANKYCNANHSFSYRSILSKRFPFIINGILMVAHVRHRPPQATDDTQHRVVSYISSLREQVCTRDIVIIVGYSMLVILPLCWCLITIYLERVQNQNDQKKKNQSPHCRRAIKILWQILQTDENYYPDAKINPVLCKFVSVL